MDDPMVVYIHIYLYIYKYIMFVYWCSIVLNLHVAKLCASAIVCPKSQLDTKLLRFAKFPTANRSEIQVRVPNSIPALCSTQPVQIVDGPWLFCIYCWKALRFWLKYQGVCCWSWWAKTILANRIKTYGKTRRDLCFWRCWWSIIRVALILKWKAWKLVMLIISNHRWYDIVAYDIWEL